MIAFDALLFRVCLALFGAGKLESRLTRSLEPLILSRFIMRNQRLGVPKFDLATVQPDLTIPAPDRSDLHPWTSISHFLSFSSPGCSAAATFEI